MQEMEFIDDMLVDIVSREGPRFRCRLLKDTRVRYRDGSEGVCAAGTMLDVNEKMVESLGKGPVSCPTGAAN